MKIAIIDYGAGNIKSIQFAFHRLGVNAVLSNNPDESYTRNPDLTGEFEQHAGIESASGALFSPGTKLNGTSF